MDKDILIYIGITLLILVCGGIIIYYQINDNFTECVSNPFVYGAQQYERQYNTEIYGNFFLDKQMYYFNSSNIQRSNILN